MTIVYVRPPSPALKNCELTWLPTTAIDVELARQQHLAYQQALQHAGSVLQSLPALDQHADGVFIEDSAILIGSHAIIARPAMLSRRAEARAAKRDLTDKFDLHEIKDGTLDGGDVMCIGRTLYVGQSTRTDRAGYQALAQIAKHLGLATKAIPVTGCLHLKTAVTCAGYNRGGDQVLVANPRWVNLDALPTLPMLAVADGEPFAGNVIRLGEQVIAAASSPITNASLAAAGFDVCAVDISEFQKAEAGLSCMSLISEQ